MLEVLEALRCAPLCILEAVEGGLCLLEVFEVLKMFEMLEVLEMLEVIRCVLLCMLEAAERGFSFGIR